MAGQEQVPGRRSASAPPPWQREIRSARFPQGLPDRCDLTVLEAFDDAWLLLEHIADAYRIVGVARDYADARAWLTADDQCDEG